MAGKMWHLVSSIIETVSIFILEWISSEKILKMLAERTVESVRRQMGNVEKRRELDVGVATAKRCVT